MNIEEIIGSTIDPVSVRNHAIESFSPPRFTASSDYKTSMILALLDSLHFGVVMLDTSGKIFIINESAKKLATQSKGFRITPNYRLTFKGSSLRRSQTSQKKSIQGEIDLGNITDKRIVIITKPSSSSKLLFKLIPIQEFMGGHAADKSGTLVFIIDPDRSHSISVNAFSKLFNLTQTEHIIVHLLTNGLNLNEISEERNTTISTVRKQIKDIFLKTGSNSQLDIVRLALGLNTPFNNC